MWQSLSFQKCPFSTYFQKTQEYKIVNSWIISVYPTDFEDLRRQTKRIVMSKLTQVEI